MDLAIQVYVQASNENSLQELLQGSSDPNELSSSIFLARVWRTTPAVKSALRLFKVATRCIDSLKKIAAIFSVAQSKLVPRAHALELETSWTSIVMQTSALQGQKLLAKGH